MPNLLAKTAYFSLFYTFADIKYFHAIANIKFFKNKRKMQVSP